MAPGTLGIRLMAKLHWLFIRQASWIVLASSLTMTYAMGNRVWWAPWLGLATQFFWGVLAYRLWKQSGDLGLAAATVFYAIVHIRNGLLWWGS